MKYLVSPSAEDAFELINDNDGNVKKRMVTIVGHCKVDYSGRAKSFSTMETGWS